MDDKEIYHFEAVSEEVEPKSEDTEIYNFNKVNEIENIIEKPAEIESNKHSVTLYLIWIWTVFTVLLSVLGVIWRRSSIGKGMLLWAVLSMLSFIIIRLKLKKRSNYILLINSIISVLFIMVGITLYNINEKSTCFIYPNLPMELSVPVEFQAYCADLETVSLENFKVSSNVDGGIRRDGNKIEALKTGQQTLTFTGRFNEKIFYNFEISEGKPLEQFFLEYTPNITLGEQGYAYVVGYPEGASVRDVTIGLVEGDNVLSLEDHALWPIKAGVQKLLVKHPELGEKYYEVRVTSNIIGATIIPSLDDSSTRSDTPEGYEEITVDAGKTLELKYLLEPLYSVPGKVEWVINSSSGTRIVEGLEVLSYTINEDSFVSVNIDDIVSPPIYFKVRKP